MHCSAGSDVSFLLRSVEEREGEDGDGYRDPDVQEFVCQGALVFVMGSSRSFNFRNETPLSGRTGNVLVSAWFAHLASDWIRSGRGWGSTPLSFLAAIMEQGS